MKLTFKTNHMKKMKLKHLMILPFVLLSGNFLAAQSIYFKNADGSKDAYKLTDVRKITFANDSLHLFLNDGNQFKKSLSAIENYQYNSVETISGVEKILHEGNDWNLKVYPNPTESVLNFTYNLTSADDVFYTVFDMNGKKMIEKKLGYQPEGIYTQSVSLEALSSGSYVFQINGKNLSITKNIIKQ
jgi:hypothetical protein